MPKQTFLSRVVLNNYKSIAKCAVKLQPLTFLVGPNGAGKSNFLDALRFVSDSLRTSLEYALRERSGIKEVRRRSGGHPTHFGIRLEFILPSGRHGTYAFRVGARKLGGFEVQQEECSVTDEHDPLQKHYFKADQGELSHNVGVAPALAPDRLYLVAASGLPEFRPVFETLSRMGFYNLNPEVMRDLQAPDAGDLLLRDGANIASVLARLSRQDKPIRKLIEEFLQQVVPGVCGAEARTVGPKETIEFRQEVTGAKDPWRFLAANMSDGTLRVLGILVALFQSSEDPRGFVPLVGIEEPEIALHPAAAGALLDSLRHASEKTQVLVTSHSPDLLDDNDIETDSILAVVAERGESSIGPIDEAGRSALRDRLYTPGELLRMNQLTPDREAIRITSPRQLRLFAEN